jgi:hypothetical protein
LEKRAEQVPPGSEGAEERERWGAEGKMAQTMYTHMNKQLKKSSPVVKEYFIWKQDLRIV